MRTAVTASRRAAADILAALRDGQLLDQAMARHADALEPRDRRWVQELVYGQLRRRAQLDARLERCVQGGLARLDADLVDLLRLGSQQLLHMDSVPAYAAIAQTVELAKARHGRGAAGLVNAVLRRIDRERGTPPAVPDDALDALALETSHPRWLLERWVRQVGLDEATTRARLDNHEAPIVLRAVGQPAQALADELARDGVATTRDALLPDSVVLPLGAPLLTLAVFTEGRCVVQDPAATLVARYAAPADGALVADLCAAPGGKAIALAERARLVVAADRSAARVERLLVGLGRVASERVHTIVADARHPAVRAADLVLVDAPCTGTGTFRRHPDAPWRLRIADMSVLPVLQRELLEGAAQAVAPGGLLVYSTCSLEPEENDDVVDAFLATHAEFRLEAPPAGAVPEAVLDRGRLRVRPEAHGVDGAFAARLRRVA